MKKIVTTVLALSFATGATAVISSNTSLTSYTDQVSYSMGFKTGEAMKKRDVAINTTAFAQGLQAGYQNQKSALTAQQMQTVLTKMQTEMMQKMQQQFQQQAATNKKAGQAFLDQNKTKPGIVTLPSGLQYKVIDAGKGTSPTGNDTVTVNYEGTFLNGKVFDSSYQRGKPISFAVKDVIKGWQEALTHMKPGATWMLYIPSNLAYGPQGSMGGIGPNETLVFKVDLINIKKS